MPFEDNSLLSGQSVFDDLSIDDVEVKSGWVYFISEQALNGAVIGIKVGYSKEPSGRIANLQTGNSNELTLMFSVRGTKADERRLHSLLASYNIKNEWFTVHPFVSSVLEICSNSGKVPEIKIINGTPIKQET